MGVPWLALWLMASPVTPKPPAEAPPDRALLEFLAEFEVDDPEGDADFDPLWLATPDAAAELDPPARATPETDPDAENDGEERR